MHVVIYEDSMMKFNKKGFTLTELLIALAVVGILVAILMPVIRSIMPNQKVLMAKRAHSAIESIVSNLLNDSACYPEEIDNDGDPITGFDNGFGYQDCDLWGGDDDTKSTIPTAGEPKVKFEKLFIDKLQLKDEDPSFANTGMATQIAQFTTKDGMKWGIGYKGDDFIQIVVDVNGDEGPNKGDSANASLITDRSVENNLSEYDVAEFSVKSDGTVEAKGNWTKAAIDVNTRINGD